MFKGPMFNGISRTTIATLAVTCAVLAAPTASRAAGSVNLLPNPGFEQSVLPGEVVAAAFNQPVLPTGWATEGAAGLFDHTPHNSHKGQYAAAISVPASGPRRDCSAGCQELPGGDTKDTAYGTGYSVAPAWRNALPVTVTAGTKYRFAAWMRLSIPRDATGGVTRVRWLNAQNVPISSSNGPSLIAPTKKSNYATFVGNTATGETYTDQSTDWTFKSATVTAPAGAASAVILLGFTDDLFISQVTYDDACFAAVVGTLSACD